MNAACARMSKLFAELSDVCAALASAPEPPEHADELLRIREACARMKWTYSWAVKHWAALGGLRDLDGKLKIRASVLAKHGT